MFGIVTVAIALLLPSVGESATMGFNLFTAMSAMFVAAGLMLLRSAFAMR